jgi:hypothetical protein
VNSDALPAWWPRHRSDTSWAIPPNTRPALGHPKLRVVPEWVLQLLCGLGVLLFGVNGWGGCPPCPISVGA